MRVVDVSVLREMLAPQTGHLVVPIITVMHSTLSSPLRYVADTQDLIFNGNTYTAFPFEIKPPDDDEDTVPDVKLVIDNVGQDLVDLIRQASDPPDVEMYIVDKAPDGTVQPIVGPLNFRMNGVGYNQEIVEISLGYEVDVLNMSATSVFFNPSVAPGLFKV